MGDAGAMRQDRSKSFIYNRLGLDQAFGTDIDGKAQKAPEELEKTLFSGGNGVNAHIGSQHFGDADGAVGLLKILDNCNPSAAYGES